MTQEQARPQNSEPATRGLAGKVAIVTGASRGIGRAIAERLARDGAKVVVNYVNNEEAAREVVESIGATGGEAVAVGADIGDADDITRLFEETMERFGRLDVLVNNAGSIVPKPIAQTTREDFDQMFSVAVRGPFFAIQEAAGRMEEGGRIVNISAAITLLRLPGTAALAGAKAALEQFTRIGAAELAPQSILVNAVSPGIIDTDTQSGNPPEVMEQLAQMSLMGRIGQPEEVADVVAFLAGEESRWITGQTIQVGGGTV